MMNRREFGRAVAVAVATLPFRGVLAQTMPPRVMLFGMTVIDKRWQSLDAWCPAINVPLDQAQAKDLPGPNLHQAFIVAPKSIVSGLGLDPMSTMGSNLGMAHADLEQTETSDLFGMACIAGQTLNVDGGGKEEIHSVVAAHLPNIADIAKIVDPASNPDLVDIRSRFPGSSKVELRGGTLRLPQVRSKNKGTHAIRWRFQVATEAKGEPYYLADVVEFRGNGNSMELKLGDQETTLNLSQTLWVINVPYVSPKDDTPCYIEHGHSWFSVVGQTPPGNLELRALDSYSRDVSTGKALTHPCSFPLTPRYFPPDTDPCFSVLV